MILKKKKDEYGTQKRSDQFPNQAFSGPDWDEVSNISIFEINYKCIFNISNPQKHKNIMVSWLYKTKNDNFGSPKMKMETPG